MDTGDLLSFGPYLLDPQERRLTRDGADVRMASRHFDLLCLLASHAGQVVPKEKLIEGVWHDVTVTTGSLEQGLFALRQTLPMPSGHPLIETQARRGVRFVAPVSRVARRESDHALDAIMETHRAWIEGRAALDTLERGAIARAAPRSSASSSRCRRRRPRTSGWPRR